MNSLGAIVIPLYLFCIVGVAIYSGRGAKTFKDYALASGKMPWYVLSATILASLIGGGVMMGYVGSFYQYGMMYFWMTAGLLCGQLIMAYFLAERLRRFEVFTIADILYKRYSKRAKMIVGIINMIVGIAVGFAMLSSFSTLLSGFVGISIDLARVICVVLFIITTTLGGFKGVAVTNVIQSIIIIGGAVTVTIYSFINAGGISGLSQLPANLIDITAPNIPPLTFVGSVVSAFCMAIADQATTFQSVNAARTPKEARRATCVSAWLSLICMLLIMIMGLSARVILGDGFSGNNVIVELLNATPAVLSTFYSAAIIAAVLSTANAMYISASMTFSRDLVPLVKPDIDDRTQVLVGRGFVCAMAIAAYFVVKFMPSIMAWIMIGYSCITCLAIPLYGGLLNKKATPASGELALGLSIVGVVVWEVLGSPFGISSAFVAITLGIIGFVLGLFSQKKSTKEQQELVDIFKAKHYSN